MASSPPPTPMANLVPVPDVVQQFAEQRNMNVVQKNAQRMYGPSKSALSDFYPPKGSEVFVGHLPRDIYEPELVPFLEKVGPIFQLRLLMDFSGTNRGYCFAQYFHPRQANDAVAQLHGAEIKPRWPVIVAKSVDNRRLLLGGVPTYKSKIEIYEELKAFSEGVTRIWKRWLDPPRTHRGAVLVTYESHRAAALARSKMLAAKFTLWGYKISVDWAEPQEPTNHSEMLEPQVLRVTNLPRPLPVQQLWDIFNRESFDGVKHINKFGTIAYISFFTRRHAETARAALNSTLIDGKEIVVDWNNPGTHSPPKNVGQRKRAKRRNRRKRRNNCQTPDLGAQMMNQNGSNGFSEYVLQPFYSYPPHWTRRQPGQNYAEQLTWNPTPCFDPGCIWSLENPALDVTFPPLMPWEPEWTHVPPPQIQMVNIPILPPPGYYEPYEVYDQNFYYEETEEEYNDTTSSTSPPNQSDISSTYTTSTSSFNLAPSETCYCVKCFADSQQQEQSMCSE